MPRDDDAGRPRDDHEPEPPRAEHRDPRDLREAPRSYNFEDWALI